MADFFISYNIVDKLWAEWVAGVLEENSYSVIIQEWDFRPGNDFVVCMDNALKENSVLISILSPDYLTSACCQAEWASKFCEDPTGTQRKIIPIKVRETAIGGLLRSRIHIDLVGLEEEQAKERLLQGVSQERAKPSHPPPFPGTKPTSKRPRFPGTLPETWNVPFLRNNNFTGRIGVFQAIEASLDSQIPSSRIHSIHGLSGTGKTQVLVEYAYRFSAKYDLVWWIKSESPETVLTNYLDLAEKIGLDIFDIKEPKEKIGAIRRWLETNCNWLLIFDNAKRPEDLIGFLPRSATGDVLISSTYPHWGELCKDTLVSAFSREESLEFIYKRTTQDCIDEANLLAESLGDLPLALAQACAYIEAKGLQISEYNGRYKKYHVTLLDRGIPRDYPLSLVKTLEISYHEIESQSKVATDLLSLLCFFAPNDIDLSILSKDQEAIQEPLRSVLGNELLLDDTLEILLNYSLIERNRDYISLHRLVQSILRNRLEEPFKRQMSATALKILCDNCLFDFSDFNNWPKVLPLLPHALVTIEIAESLTLDGGMRGFLLNQLGIYFTSIGDYDVAAKTFKRSLESFEPALDREHPIYARVLNNYVITLRHLEDPSQLSAFVAELEKSLDIHIRTFGPQSPEVAPAHTALGVVLKDIGGKENLIKAEKHFMFSYITNRDHIEENPLRASTDLSNLASIRQELGGSDNLMRARLLLEEALSIDEKYFGSNHPIYAMHLNNYALLLQDLGRTQRQHWLCKLANTKLHEACRIMLEKYGDQHPETRIVLENLRNSDAFLSKLNQS
ncbi:toll/interleukin-1 receptor domain-containing protein [Methanoculleus sp. UBA291]|uniref:tetratricopeptide repeat protein n=1 Tax=Methanoculleus sp. UBA291 TaxID=1915495 RepID=UPI00316ACEB4